MEQHPVPQDITGFQFKLIGDMTVKQFVYLAGGLVIAFVISRLNIISVIKYPLLAVFGIGGAALAFLDVGKRPLDRIVLSFFKSVYRETRFIWKKTPQIPDILLETPNINKARLGTMKPRIPQNNIDLFCRPEIFVYRKFQLWRHILLQTSLLF